MAALLKLARELDAVLAMAKPDQRIAAMLRDCTETAVALRRLETAGELMSAARIAAFALPRREAVWWAAMCVTHTAPDHQPAVEVRAREAAELWVRQPEDRNRREAMNLARAAGFNAAESWVAVAAFWSGDSLAPAGEPAIAPAPHLPGTAVAGAVAMAAVRDDPIRKDARLRRFLGSLRDIADGGAGRLASERAA